MPFISLGNQRKLLDHSRSTEVKDRWGRNCSVSKQTIKLQVHSIRSPKDFSCAAVSDIKEAGSSATKQDIFKETRAGETKYTGKQAVVVGAGPAGCVVAAYLAQQGFYVKVYERLKDPNTYEASANRQFIIQLNAKTAAVLRAAHIDLPSETEYRDEFHCSNGVCSLSKDGVLRKFLPKSKGTFRGSRQGIVKHLLNAVKMKYSEHVKFYFEHSCAEVDIGKHAVTLIDNRECVVKDHYDLLIGADGVNSKVREELETQVKEFKVKRVDIRFGYKIVHGLNALNLESNYENMLEPGIMTMIRFHSGYTNHEYPTGGIFYQQSDRSLSGIIKGTKEAFSNISGWEKKWLTSALPNNFPDQWIDSLAQQFHDNPLFTIPSIIRCSSCIGPRMILIGDSAHNVTSELAAGCNTAIQDVKVLADALSSGNGSIELAIRSFNDLRYKEIEALQDLEERNPLVPQTVRGRLNPCWQHARFHLYFRAIANRLVPQLASRSVFFRFATASISAREAIAEINTEMTLLLVITATFIGVICKAAFSM